MESQRSFLFIALLVVTFYYTAMASLDNAPVVRPTTRNGRECLKLANLQQILVLMTMFLLPSAVRQC